MTASWLRVKKVHVRAQTSDASRTGGNAEIVYKPLDMALA
jgi:hypothetical protein